MIFPSRLFARLVSEAYTVQSLKMAPANLDVGLTAVSYLIWASPSPGKSQEKYWACGSTQALGLCYFSGTYCSWKADGFWFCS